MPINKEEVFISQAKEDDEHIEKEEDEEANFIRDDQKGGGFHSKTRNLSLSLRGLPPRAPGVLA